MAAPIPPFQPYPEWKQLKAAIWPLLQTKKQFTYDELRDLCGADIQTPHGRTQFYIFRRHALKEWNIWFEVVPNMGYEVIPAGQHAKSAVKRVAQGRRKVNLAKQIQHHADYDQMTPNERILNAQVGALIDNLSSEFHKKGRELHQIAQQFKGIDMSAEGVRALADQPAKQTAPAVGKMKAIEMSADGLKAFGAKKP